MNLGYSTFAFGIAAGELDRNTKAGQRRSQFMRDILKQLVLRVKESLDSIRHPIEDEGKIADFIFTFRLNSCRQVTVAEVLHHLRELIERLRKLGRQNPAHANDHERD
jgi:hypothetical protein